MQDTVVERPQKPQVSTIDDGIRRRRRVVDPQKQDAAVAANSHVAHSNDRDSISTTAAGLTKTTVESIAGLGGSYYLSRILYTRFVGLLFLTAFSVSLFQNVALLGVSGLVPVCQHVNRLRPTSGSDWQAFLANPQPLVFTGCNDDTLTIVAFSGAVMSLIPLVFGRCNGLIMATMWMLYMCFVNAGSNWFSFGWETQLLEVSFWSIFLYPLLSLDRFDPATPAPLAIAYYMRWITFKIMVGAGLIKIRGDECWRDVTGSTVGSCMEFHYETQPNPHPLSWYFHYTPKWFHTIETATNHFAELVAPVLLFMPRRLRITGGVIQIGFQVVLILSGNLAFLNWLTIIPSIWCFDDASVAWLFSENSRCRAAAAAAASKDHHALRWIAAFIRPALRTDRSVSWAARIFTLVRTLVTASVFCFGVYLNLPVARNLLSQHQAMNRSFDSWHLANTYGAFGSIGKVRTEVIYEGTESSDPSNPSAKWLEYEFKCKPGALSKRPCLITPYHLRLDWLAWFSAMGNYQYYPWSVHLVHKLLDPAVYRPPRNSVVRKLQDLLHLPIATDARDLLAFDPFAPSMSAASPFDISRNRTAVVVRVPQWLRGSHYEYRFTPPNVSTLVSALLSNQSQLQKHPAEETAGITRAGRQQPPAFDARDAGARLCAGFPERWQWLQQSRSGSAKCVVTEVRESDDGSGRYLVLRMPSPASPSGFEEVHIGTWYTRRRIGEWLPPLQRGNPSVLQFLHAHGWAQ